VGAFGWLLAKLGEVAHPVLSIILFLVIGVPILLGLLIPHLLTIPLYRAFYLGIISVSLLMNWFKYDHNFFFGVAVLFGIGAVVSLKGFRFLA